MLVLQIVATLLSFVGAVLNIRMNRWCFLLWSVAAVLWIIWALNLEPIGWGQVVTNPLFISLNIWGFVIWSRKGRSVMGDNNVS